jgi:rod shape determining protein RodA
VKQTTNIWSGVDKITILLFLLLVIIGWFNIYAAVYNDEAKDIFDLSQRYGKQFVWILAAILIGIFVLLIDIRFYYFFSWFIYGGIILLLLLVLVLGHTIYGAKSWFEIGGFGLQPSEFAKFSTVLALAAYLNNKRQELMKTKVLATALVIIIFPSILVLLQPDTGSAIVFFALFIVLFREGMSSYIFVSGLMAIFLFFITLLIGSFNLSAALIIIALLLIGLTTRKWNLFASAVLIVGGIIIALYLLNEFVLQVFEKDIVLLISVLISGIFFAIYYLKRKSFSLLVIYLFLAGSMVFINTVDYAFNNLLAEHQRERVDIVLGLKKDLHGTGYNLNQSLISIGSGGFSGKGFLQGTQTKFKFVPKQSSDFIFCTIGEEWGFIGSTLVIVLYMTLFLRLIVLAERQRSAFSRVYGYGVVSILFAHFFINIGMAIGIIPTIGIPLPFLSYGGSSLWGFTVLLFIFLRLDASRTEYLI